VSNPGRAVNTENTENTESTVRRSNTGSTAVEYDTMAVRVLYATKIEVRNEKQINCQR